MTRHLSHRGQWLTMLAKLTSPMESSAAAQAFNAYTPMLQQFPDEVFTVDSLEFVAGNCKHGVPTYADLRKHLGEWWRENPAKPQLVHQPIADETAGLDRDAQTWVKFYRLREAENFEVPEGKHKSSREHVLSLVKAQSFAAWKRITGNDEAAEQTTYQHSETRQRTHGTTHGLKTVGAIVGRHEPTDEERDHVNDVVERGIEEINAAHDAVYDRESIKYPSRHLTREQLSAAYRKDGIANPRAKDALAEAYKQAAEADRTKVTV